MRILETLAALTLSASLWGFGCQQSPTSPDEASSSTGEFKVLKFAGPQMLAKKKKVKKNVTVANGGSLALEHGFSSGGDAGLLYGVSYKSPYKIYKINPNDPSNSVHVGELAFKTKAIAVHPETGLVYYISKNNINGLYPVAVWDPETNSNTILPSQNTTRPCDKLAFDVNGTLYAVDRDNKDEMYTINTSTGAWTFLKKFNEHLSAYGDMAWGNGVFYNVNGYNSKFKIMDLDAGVRTTVDKTDIDDLSGIACGSNGVLYMSDENGKLYSVNPTNASTTYLGNTGISELEDLTSPYFETELAFVSVSLDILPGAISEDTEIEFSLETTEISVTFQPHGITFSTPAILNIVAHGVDFSGIDPNAVDIYYDNEEIGNWELIDSDDVIINVSAGTVQVVNAKLPHLSRYAIGAE